MIKIDKHLMVSQEWLRNTSQIVNMVNFVKDGGFWTKEALKEWAAVNKLSRVSPLIQITQFPDEQRMIQDGHHRLVSTVIAGRDYIKDEEFEIQYWTYDEYLEINIANGWYTPYDPCKEVRLNDIGAFKAEVRRLLQIARDKKESAYLLKALNYIDQNRSMYAIPRRITTVQELCAEILKSSKELLK
jgi:hypothetical protein